MATISTRITISGVPAKNVTCLKARAVETVALKAVWDKGCA